MKRIKLSKAGMLIHNDSFKTDCNELRKLINKHNKYSSMDVFLHEQTIKETAFAISLQCRIMMSYYKISLYTICQVLRTTPRTIHKITVRYSLKTSIPRKVQSLLVDRLHYARLIVDGIKTRQDVMKLNGYGYSTVCRWVHDYIVFGNKTLDQAVAFRRVL